MGDALPPIALGAGLKSVQINMSAVTGSFHCAVLSNVRMKCWGNNSFGQLGVGSSQDLGDMLGEI